MIGEIALAKSECEIVESQTFSLSAKREAFFIGSLEDINSHGTSEKTPPASRKKIRGMEHGGEHR